MAVSLRCPCLYLAFFIGQLRSEIERISPVKLAELRSLPLFLLQVQENARVLAKSIKHVIV